MPEDGFVPEVNPPIRQAESSVNVEVIDDDLFRGPKNLLYKPPGARGTFGGQVCSQALMAAAHTVPSDVPIHSLHCYFIRGGDSERDIIYHVKRLRDGKSFFTRTVVAKQGGVALFTMAVQFHRPEPSRGLAYHDPMPSVHPPDALMDIYEYWRAISSNPSITNNLKEYLNSAQRRPVSIDQRIVHRAFLRDDSRYREELIPTLWPLMVGNGKAERFIWMKSHVPLTGGPNIHKCVIAYMSDMAIIPTAMEPLYSGITKPPRITMTVSLDHSMWFHALEDGELRADEWLLFGMTCHATGGARALLTAKVWNQRGQLVVTVKQEALIRLQDLGGGRGSRL
jgi:acyl-CoA thioesterase II